MRDPIETDASATRLLLVDDHDDAADVLRILLARRGFNVTVARSVGTALAATEAATLDVLVSDIRLPDGSGHDLLRQLRAVRRIPAIALSGLDRAASKSGATDGGFDEYLYKPVAIDNLVAAVRRVCPNRVEPQPRGGR
jgi:two-component system CheB/CheR fusion protein